MLGYGLPVVEVHCLISSTVVGDRAEGATERVGSSHHVSKAVTSAWMVW